MKRDIDLHIVAPEHLEVHARLLNWGRWSNPRSAGSAVQPMFRGYSPYLVPRGSSGASDIDTLDAQAIQKIMHRVPEKQARALGFHYVHPYVSPGKVCRLLGVNFTGLRDLVGDGRTMVKNLLKRG